MLENWFILLPEIFLLGFFVVGGLVAKFREVQTPKTFASLAQIFLVAVILFSIVFYNKSAFPLLWANTPLSTIFKTFAYLMAWAWFYLSSKWFLNKNRPSFKFYAVCFALLFGFDILASATSLISLAVIIPFICFFYRRLILRHWDTERVEPIAKAYGFFAAVFCLLLWLGVYIIYIQTGSFEYAIIRDFYAAEKNFAPTSLLAVVMIISCFIFLLSLVPFHLWFIAAISEAVLPVCGFITLVPPLIYIGALINLMKGCLVAFTDFVAPLLCFFAVLSLLIGAFSANSENNIRKKFAFLSIYCIGFALTGMVHFSGSAVIASFAYMIIAILSLAGVYTVFLGLKSKGEYISNITYISGFYRLRPYMSAALLIFMFSLIGLAPTLGFFGYLSIINNLVADNSWFLMGVLLISLLFVASACFQVIRIIYFEPLVSKFDRADKAIYICLFINVTFILASLINPAWLIRDALVVLGGIS